jgi:phosphatidylserine decarboxylase
VTRTATPHQYLRRDTGEVLNERLYWDRVIRFLYCEVRERAPTLFRVMTGSRVTALLGFVNYDSFLGGRVTGGTQFLAQAGIDPGECLDPPENLTTPRSIFQRKIRYEVCRPLPDEPDAIVSPADARVVIGSCAVQSALFLKGKLFTLDELLGRGLWISAFRSGDAAIFRLTPELYHYNHTPVAGRVADIYELAGEYNSCNPQAVVEMVTPYSRNRRTVTIIDTDFPGGSRVGLVAMIEVAALMIGAVDQCYSDAGYEAPRPVVAGMMLRKGLPKSLFRPGSSTTILLFQKERVRFNNDLLLNQRRSEVQSRFTLGFGLPLAETEVRVRSVIAWPVTTDQSSADRGADHE